MPGRTPEAAREAFLEPLRRAVSCLTDAQLFVPRKAPGDLEVVTPSDDPIVLRSALGTVGFQFGHQFRTVRASGHVARDQRWHVSTAAYSYQLYDENDAELIAWHWHPGTVRRPHLHAPAGPIGKRMHVPTGRVSVEAVLRFLLTELDVHTRRPADEVHEILDAAEDAFIRHRRWHAWRGG